MSKQRPQDVTLREAPEPARASAREPLTMRLWTAPPPHVPASDPLRHTRRLAGGWPELEASTACAPAAPEEPSAASDSTGAGQVRGGFAGTPLPATKPSAAPPGATGSRAERYAEAKTHLLREAALRAYEEGERLTSALRVTPSWSWSVGLCLLSVVVAAIAAASLCSIDVVGRGEGILQAVGGTRSIASALGGRIATIHVSSGTIVRAGDELVSIDATELQSKLVQTRQRIRATQTQLARLRGPDQLLFKRGIEQLEQQLRLLQRRVHSQRESADELQVRLGNVGELSSRGYVPEVEVRELSERMRELERVRLSLEQQVSETRLAIVTSTRQRDAQLHAAEVERESAEGEERALGLLIQQSSIVAPNDGRVEAVVVKPGELVQVGTIVARIVPPQLPSQVVAFFPDRDRAFLRPGSAVRLEVAQLPSSEFGTLRGHVSRVASSFASAEELQAVFGAQARLGEASYRTDIVLDDDPRTRALLSKLRAGTQLSARATLRERRLITLLFDPLRRYLE